LKWRAEPGKNFNYNPGALEKQARVRKKWKINLKISLVKNPARDDFNRSHS
jgi:hypothetical protein